MWNSVGFVSFRSFYCASTHHIYFFSFFHFRSVNFLFFLLSVLYLFVLLHRLNKWNGSWSEWYDICKRKHAFKDAFCTVTNTYSLSMWWGKYYVNPLNRLNRNFTLYLSGIHIVHFQFKAVPFILDFLQFFFSLALTHSFAFVLFKFACKTLFFSFSVFSLVLRVHWRMDFSLEIKKYFRLICLELISQSNVFFFTTLDET